MDKYKNNVKNNWHVMKEKVGKSKFKTKLFP